MARKHGVREGDVFIAERPQSDGAIRGQAHWPVLRPDGSSRYRSRTFATQEEAEDHLRPEGRRRSDGMVPDTKVRVLIRGLDQPQRLPPIQPHGQHLPLPRRP